MKNSAMQGSSNGNHHGVSTWVAQPLSRAAPVAHQLEAVIVTVELKRPSTPITTEHQCTCRLCQEKAASAALD